MLKRITNKIDEKILNDLENNTISFEIAFLKFSLIIFYLLIL